MAIKSYKPTTPGRRDMTTLKNENLSKNVKPERSLLISRGKTGGRNNLGRITTRHIGGGAKRRYRLIDFKRNKDGVPAKVATIEYDPNRSANIALLHYLDGEKRYILAPKGIKVGDMVESGVDADIKPGNAKVLADIPEGTVIHNIELKPGRGAQLVRSAGTAAQVLGREEGYTSVQLASGEVRRILSTCRATVGAVGNESHSLIVIGKAGRNRNKGIRPTVRGTAMNPVDHPHGGGEGRTPIGRDAPRTPWGKKAMGVKTRKDKRASTRLITRRRNEKKK